LPEVHYSDEAVTLWHGDALEVMRQMPAASVDAVVCDPPYELTDGGKQDCASDVLRNAIIRDAAYDEAASHKRSIAFRITGTLGAAVGIGSVDLDDEVAARQKEVDRDGAGTEVDDVLMNDRDPVLDEQGERGEFRLWVREGEPRCVGTCRCLAQSGKSILRVPVGLRYDPSGDAERSAGVVAFGRAELPAVLALDVRRNTAELLPARGAEAIHPRFLLLPAKTVRARSAARRLAAVLEPNLVGPVTDAADGTGPFHLRAHADLLRFARPILSPRGFMGRAWDGSGIAFDERFWGEVRRVLKPGGHLLAFGGSRTWHRLTCGIEDAGFEIRDTITWLYGSGFPKSLDVSKAIDRAAGAEREVIGRTVTPFKVDAAATRGTSLQGSVNGDFSRQVDAEGYRYTEHTSPATDDARRWQGWGTALKPASEPIVVARKPLAGTVAQTVQAYGTGALNVDGCRVPHASAEDRRESEAKNQHTQYANPGSNRDSYSGSMPPRTDYDGTAGRWPSNVVLSHVGYALYALRHDVPAEIAATIHAHYGHRQALREVRGGVSGDAIGAGQAPVLLSGVRQHGTPGGQGQAVGQADLRAVPDRFRGNAGLGQGWAPAVLFGALPGSGDAGEPEPPRQGPYAGSASQDGRQSREGRAVGAMEGRPVREQGVHPCADCDAAPRGARTCPEDDAARVHPGAPSDCGCADGSPANEGRRGAPRQRGEDGQPPGEPDRDTEGGSLRRASGDRAPVPRPAVGTGAVTRGELRLEIPAHEVPRGWLRYFQPAGEVDACSGPDGCVRGCPVAELDRQSGNRVSGWRDTDTAPRVGAVYDSRDLRDRTGPHYSDSGGASRFFPTFRYEAKAPTSERPRDGDVSHPTVKPLDLMRWLVRLVTPPGGLVLDPFAGSGTTGEACVLEGFRCHLIELEAAHLPLIVKRLAKPMQLGLFGTEE
jgi:DNA modification methylase